MIKVTHLWTVVFPQGKIHLRQLIAISKRISEICITDIISAGTLIPIKTIEIKEMI